MEPITVRHALGRYPVYLEPGVLDLLAELVEAHLGGRTLALVTDAVTGRLYEEWESGARDAWRADPAAPRGAPVEFATRLAVPAGERYKTRESWATLTDALLDQGFGRDSALVGVGGGVVGDLAGFVAATYQRGIPFLLVPTTLLAMLDASVGGKTGVDTPHGKNLIGAFHPPATVVIDPAVLRTLPEREFRHGLAEAVKHGLIADADYLGWIEAHADGLLARELPRLTALIRRSVEIKAAVVGADEREGGQRAILNAGHTVAHALEQVSQYGIAHGEAVALGLVAEAAMGERLGVTAAGTADRLAALCARLGLPVTSPVRATVERLRVAMLRDKKNRAGEIRCALPVAPGTMAPQDGSWTVPVDAATLAAGLGRILG